MDAGIEHWDTISLPHAFAFWAKSLAMLAYYKDHRQM
jgi:hypothetical protein